MDRIKNIVTKAFVNQGNIKLKNDCIRTNGNTTAWYYHGNLIAHIKGNLCVLSDCSWRSATTKKRLNFILKNLKPEARIYQKDFVWYIDNFRWEGEVGFYFNKETL